MKFSKLHKGSVVKVIEDDISIEDFIYSTLKSPTMEERKDSLFVCDVGKVVQRWDSFHELLPQVQPFYAVKCNPDHNILQVLADLGSNFDCSSKGEIKIITDLGVNPNRIIFSNPSKQTSHIRYAKSIGVKMLTFDNELELHKIKKYYPNADLVIRININGSKSTGELAPKYAAHSPELKLLLGVAWKLELKVVGISFRVGSGCSDSSIFYDAVKDAKWVYDLGQEVGFNFTLLDVGDGFPLIDNEKISFEETALSLSCGLADFFPPGCGVKVIAEPGSYFVASAFTIVCNITSVHEVASAENDAIKSFMYYINDGVYGSFNCVVLNQHSPVPYPLKDSDGFILHQCSIWGPTGDSLDCIASSAMLPKMNTGEWICFKNMGAYTIPCPTQFNKANKTHVIYMCHRSMMDYTDIADTCMSCKDWAAIPTPRYPVAAVY